MTYAMLEGEVGPPARHSFVDWHAKIKESSAAQHNFIRPMYYPVTYFMPAYNTKQWRSELTDSPNAVRIISTMVKTSYTRILRKLAMALT